MDSLSVYVPMDRLNALIRGEALAERAEGAALFADLSGFTALTELLIQNLGPKRGAEKLLVFLDRIYEPLIIQVHNYGGSVIGFSGDAITCWFNLDTGIQAIASALAMQEEMKAFASLEILDGIEVSIGLKVAVAAGTARRFLVGEPDIQVIDVLAGSPLEHLAQAEHLAARGEVLVDSATANYLTGEIEIAEWRLDPEAGEYYAVVKSLTVPFQPRPWPDLEANLLDRQFLRQWLLPPIYQRLQSGMGEFLAELRPAVALFLRFGGIDYDEDDSAGVKLDAYIRQVQRIIARFEGSLIQLTVGDKGSYLFAAFGAPIAHEDDANRAVLAAVELSKILPVEGPGKRVQIGISEGRMRTGAYGGSSRRTYGVLGPQTNLAARLMQAAAPGQILVSQLIYKATLAQYNWLELPAIQLKGVREPLPVFALNEYTDRRSIHLQEPQYNLPMVGRKSELAAIEASIQKTLAGQGQIVVITGEAGMGKSRLVAESIRLCLENGLVGFGGECESYGTNTSYHLWYSIWRAFFNVDPGWSVEESSTMLQDTLAQVDPSLVPRLPLLGPVLNLPFPDNDLTRSLDAKRRKTLLEGLLITCLRARAHQQPLLFVLENCHWMDPLSAELAAVVARSIADVPVILLLALRPVEDQENRENPLGPIKTYTAIQLTELPDEEVELLIQLKLEQIYAGQTGLPSRLIQYIGKRAQGNPFYIEELLNYLRDMNINPQNSSALEQIELPESLNSLVLSRIDQCTESQKITLKVASVLGRLFIAAWLWGAFPDLSRPEMVQTDLDELRRLELTSLEKTEPELTYLFKHIITQEVAYESLPYATRSLLHGQIAQFIENTYPDKISQNVDLLAFHYELSFNEPKKREYLLKAGQTAQANYANQAALNYYQHLIPLIQGSERVDVMLKLGQVYELVGQWDAAKNLYQSGLQIGEALEDRNLQALCQTATGELLRKRGAYPD
ncbi:MAG TPA: AAA family ATPase, partial [Anaerolineales bacterium]|nr:AAA family ATPase [Anaerolineales bacterium]